MYDNPSPDERAPRPAGPDIVVCPWPRGGWAVLRVGNVRPGRVRPTEREAVRVGSEFARALRSRLFVSTEEVSLEQLAELARSDFRAGDLACFRAPLIDARATPSRLERRRTERAAPHHPPPSGKVVLPLQREPK